MPVRLGLGSLWEIYLCVHTCLVWCFSVRPLGVRAGVMCLIVTLPEDGFQWLILTVSDACNPLVLKSSLDTKSPCGLAKDGKLNVPNASLIHLLTVYLCMNFWGT